MNFKEFEVHEYLIVKVVLIFQKLVIKKFTSKKEKATHQPTYCMWVLIQ